MNILHETNPDRPRVGTLSRVLSALAYPALLSVATAGPVLYYNFDDPGGPGSGPADIIDQAGTADVEWGLGGSANPDPPLGDTLGSSFTSTGATSVADQATAPVIGTGDFSISFWVNLPSSEIAGAANPVFDMQEDTTEGGIQFFVTPADALNLGVGTAGPFADNRTLSLLPLDSFDAWTHIAVTVDRDSATGMNILRRWASSSKRWTPPRSQGVSIAANQDLVVGGGNNLPLNGSLDELAIYPAILTSAEVAGLAAGTLTPPTVTSGAPILYYNFDQTGTPPEPEIEDLVGTADAYWGVDAAEDTDSPLGDTLGSAFNSTSADTLADQATAPVIGTGDFSVSFWMNLPSSEMGTPANGIFDMLAGTTPGGIQMLISPGDQIAIGVAADSGFQNRLSSVALSASEFDTWTHVAVTVDRDSPTGIAYYVNGVQFGATQDPTAYAGTPTAANQNLQVGSANAVPFNGSLDDLAIFTEVLTSAQVASLANGSKTPLTVIDTAAILITGSTFDVPGGQASLTWTSQAGATYAIDESPDLSPSSWVENRSGISGQAGQTTSAFSILPRNVGKLSLFFRIRRE